MHYNFRVDKDIKKAETLPSKFYMDQSIFDLVKEKIFSKSWHWIGHENLVKEPNSIHPITLMENFLDEPILLTKDNNGVISCLSNVCTHRGNILALNSIKAKKLVCMYHGRRFNSITIRRKSILVNRNINEYFFGNLIWVFRTTSSDIKLTGN